MVFYILTTIVFIAELIIAAAILIHLTKISKLFNEYNTLLDELKPTISDLLKTFTEISEQAVKLAPIVAETIKSVLMNMVMGQIKSVLAGLTFWLVKTEVEKHVNK